MKKLTKLSLLAMTLLVSHIDAKDKKKDSQEKTDTQTTNKSYWTWENGRWVLAGAAALGAGALAYAYQDEIKDWLSSMSPQEALEQKADLEASVMQDLQDVRTAQENVADKANRSAESVAQIQENIAQKQEEIAKKQTMLEYLQSFFTSEPLSEDDRLTDEEQAAWRKQNQDDREPEQDGQAGSLVNKIYTPVKNTWDNVANSYNTAQTIREVSNSKRSQSASPARTNAVLRDSTGSDSTSSTSRRSLAGASASIDIPLRTPFDPVLAMEDNSGSASNNTGALAMEDATNEVDLPKDNNLFRYIYPADKK